MAHFDVLDQQPIKSLKTILKKIELLVRRFQNRCKEPNKDEAIKIIEGLKTYYEKHHGIKIFF